MASARVAVALALAALSGNAHAQRAWEVPGDQEASEARQLAGAGRCDQAIDRFDAAITKRPKDPELRRDRGLCHDQLGNPMPAIDDFRAYLAERPKAPDAFRVRTRLEELEQQHIPDSKPPDHDHDGHVEPVKTPKDLEDPFAEEAPPPTNESSVVRRGKWLVGPGVGWRKWSTGGFADPTIAIGVQVAYELTRTTELSARVAYLRTGGGGNSLGDADGFGLTAHYGLMLELSRTFDLLLAGGAALEFQTTALDTSTRFFGVRAAPGLRWNVSDQISVDVGPVVGAGLLDAVARLESNSKSEFVFHYGASAAVYLRLGNRGGPKAGTVPDPDADPERDPDEPLTEDQLWDD